MVTREIVRAWVRGLEVLKAQEPARYGALIEPFTDFIHAMGFERLQGSGAEAFSKLVADIIPLVGEPEIAPTGVKPSATAEFLAEQIKPWVQDVRLALFRSQAAPFRSATEARRWLARVNEKLDVWSKALDEWRNDVNEWHDRAGQWHKRADTWHGYWQRILAKYPHYTEGVEQWSLMKEQGIDVKLPTEHELRRLEELDLAIKAIKVGQVEDPPALDRETAGYLDTVTPELFKISKVTGFTWESIEMYILADRLPILPPYTLGILKEAHMLPSGATIENRFAGVTIRSTIAAKDLRSLYRDIREQLGLERSKPFTSEDLELYKMVLARGSISGARGETVKFWESVKDDWNKKHPYNRKRTWKGFQNRYKRITSRIDRITKGETKAERQNGGTRWLTQ
ncbi:MAG: hypothetical protein ACLFVD_01140 [Dehalococcoidia bacterium]